MGKLATEPLAGVSFSGLPQWSTSSFPNACFVRKCPYGRPKPELESPLPIVDKTVLGPIMRLSPTCAGCTSRELKSVSPMWARSVFGNLTAGPICLFFRMSHFFPEASPALEPVV